MIDGIAGWVLSHLCHQEAARAWAPGGTALALCERCAGVYVGASLMVPLLPLMRFTPTRTLSGLHAVFLLQIVVLGTHVIPHPPTIRTLSGQLFIAGVSYFLWNNLRHRWSFLRANRSPGPYLAGLFAAVLLVQLAVRTPWSFAASFLELSALLGLLAIAFVAALTFWDLMTRIAPQRPAKGN